ncbi:hypothetical protein DFH09DRAFT_1130977 [Mycena vulgaris]|nr:hypothetical protein DFH09DRAFT_1130977 [Mycena vulgaris]
MLAPALLLLCITAISSVGALTAPRTRVIVRAEDEPTTSLPLTVTLTLDESSPTLTQTAVVAAYSDYADFCGPRLARVIQDGLVQYNQQTGTDPVTDINDEGFGRWLSTEDAEYISASAKCTSAQNFLNAKEFEATSADEPTDTATTSTEATETTSIPGTSGSSNSSRTSATTSTSTSTAAGPSQSTAGASRHGPTSALILGGLVLGVLIG